MRTLLFPLAVVLLFAVAPSRAEYDAGVSTAKPKATGATFGGMASNRPAVKNPYTILDFVGVKDVAGPFVGFAIPIEFSDSATRRVRTPRTHRPANIPSLPYVESFISRDYDISISIFVPAK